MVLKGSSSLDLDIDEWRLLIINAQAHMSIMSDVRSFHGGVPDSKNKCVAIQFKPDWCHVRASVLCAVANLAVRTWSIRKCLCSLVN